MLLLLLLKIGISSLLAANGASTCPRVLTYATSKLVLTLLKLISILIQAVVVVVVAAEDGYKLTEHSQQNLSQRFNLRQVLTGVKVSSFTEAVVVVVVAAAEDG